MNDQRLSPKDWRTLCRTFGFKLQCRSVSPTIITWTLLSAAAEDHRTCADEHAHTLRSDLFTTSLNYSTHTHTHTYILSQMLGSREFLSVWNVSHSGKYNEESKRAGLRYRCGWRPKKYIPPGAIYYFSLTAFFFIIGGVLRKTDFL